MKYGKHLHWFGDDAERERVVLRSNDLHMSKRLYVGGLPYRTTEEELKDAFAQIGEVTSASIITDKMSGRSRGFGFVEMANDDEADKAIESWNGKDFNGRTLVVNEAKPMGDKPPRRNFDRDRRSSPRY